MLDAYIIKQQEQQRREREWQPQPLHLPVAPLPEYPSQDREPRPEPGTERGVTTIQL
jgi:hypothetical protein